MRSHPPRLLRLTRLLMFVSAGITLLMVPAGLMVFWEGWGTLGAMAWVVLPGVLQLVFGLRMQVGGRGLFWAIVVLHTLLILLALSNLAAGMAQGITQLLIPALVLIGVTRPASQEYFDSSSPAGRRRSGPGLLRRIHDPDRGTGFTEYAAVIVLVAAIAAAVLVTDIGTPIRTGIDDSIDAIFNGGESRAGSGAGGPDTAGGEDAPGPGGPEGGFLPAGDEDSGDDGSVTPVSHTLSEDDQGGDDDGGDGGGKSFLRHTGDFFVGIWDGIAGDVEGVIDIFTTNPLDTLKGMWDGVTEDPLSLLISPEARDAWKNGDYGKSLGLGTWDIGSWFIPGAGWAAKGGKLGKLGKVDTPDNPKPRQDAGGDKKPDRDKDTETPSCRRNSFTPGTLVLMADGSYTAIEQIAVGDLVHAFDPVDAAEGPREVTALISGSGEKTLVEVTVSDADGQGGILTATAEHPFWLPATAAWVDAVDLEPGQWLRTSAGTWTQIGAVETRTVPDQQVHNLTVESLHTYYIAVDGVEALVHNSNAGSCIPDDSHLPSAKKLIDDGQKYDKNSSYWRGRNLPATGGPPNRTLYKQDPQTGGITNYIVYDANGNAIKRVDLTGAAHNGVETPHVIPYQHNTTPSGDVHVQGLRNDVRPARADEIL